MSTINGYIISLTPTQLSVIYARRGSVQQAESISLNYEQWSDHWTDGLMRLDQPLRQLLSRFSGRKRMSATIVYQSPTITKQIYPFEQGGATTRDAARSKIREGIGYSDPVSVCTLGGESNPNKPCMMLAYSDREETLRSLYAWLNRCGVQSSAMIPMSVASIIFAANEAKRYDDYTAVLYLDAECSIISHSAEDTLTLVRPADLGFRKLIESYRQVFIEHEEKNASEDEQKPATTKSPDPFECLFRYGVPFQPVECAGVELRSAVLPCMAPVLQRIGIDIKQTIRFGIGSHDKLKNLYICGPGASIPGITKALGEHLELHVQPAPGAEHAQPLVIGGHGSIEAQLIESPLNTQGLLPSIAGDERTRKTLNRAFVAGCALAAVTIGAQFSLATSKKDRFEQQARNAEPLVERVAAFEKKRDDARQVGVILANLAALVSEHADATPQWVGALVHLTPLVGNEIRIQDIRGDLTEIQPHLVITGYAIASENRTQGQALDHFVESLAANDLVETVKLGATSRIDISPSGTRGQDTELWGLQFTMRVMIDKQESSYSALAEVSPQPAEWIEP